MFVTCVCVCFLFFTAAVGVFSLACPADYCFYYALHNIVILANERERERDDRNFDTRLQGHVGLLTVCFFHFSSI